MVTARESLEETGLNEEVSTCPHHWLIDAASGRLSKGTCRLCGAQRSFANYLEGSAWGPSEPAVADKERLSTSVGTSIQVPSNDEWVQ